MIASPQQALSVIIIQNSACSAANFTKLKDFLDNNVCQDETIFQEKKLSKLEYIIIGSYEFESTGQNNY